MVNWKHIILAVAVGAAVGAAGYVVYRYFKEKGSEVRGTVLGKEFRFRGRLSEEEKERAERLLELLAQGYIP